MFFIIKDYNEPLSYMVFWFLCSLVYMFLVLK